MYVPLWVKTNYSFLHAASHPEELVAEARGLGLPALAITDMDGVAGLVRAFVAGREQGQRLLAGTQLSVTHRLPLSDDLLTPAQVMAATVAQPVILAMDRRGYANLCRLVTWGRRRCLKGSSLVTWAELADLSSGLLLLHHNAPPPGPLMPPHLLPTELADAFAGRAYALVTRHMNADDRAREHRLLQQIKDFSWPAVAGHEVLYHSQARRPLHDVLTCIRHGVSVQTAGRLLRPNSEHALLSNHAFGQLFSDHPDWVARTLTVAERCPFDLTELRYKYPAERLPDGTSLGAHLRQLVQNGAYFRYQGPAPDDVQAQIDRELGLIDQLDYGGYFLTMWEIVEFCKAQGILCQGRGSAANSVVCYCLGITAIDPVRMGLLFERFLSLERAEPPDIDLDIEHQRREEVIQYVYRRYDPMHANASPLQDFAPCATDGRSHAAMVANVVRYRARSAVRDVGKALGLQQTDLNRLARHVHAYGDGLSETALREAGLDPEVRLHQLLVEISHEILDFPRHLSVHPGGFLLGHEPVDSLVPIENATMDSRTVIQWDKNDVESLGLFKVDLLGLGMLSQVHRCLDLLRASGQADLSMATIPSEDPETYAMIRRADTVGVFQIESRAQMSMLPRLKPRTFYDLVVEIAIIRPGPITGGMVHPYLRRREGVEPVLYPHPCLEPVLKKTLGIPLFQEQVMKLAMVAADYTPGEADQLRRDMAAWRQSGRIDQHRDKLIGRMTAKGIDKGFAEQVFEQIRGFGEYGFPESHAASFALIAYVTAWLKCHFPAEFLCALLNSWPMGFYNPATLVEDAKRHHVEILPIDVQSSRWDCTMQRSKTAGQWAVRMGLRYVQGLAEQHRQQLQANPGPYRDMDDFARRTGFARHALDALAQADAFAGFKLDRRQALWQARAASQRSRQTLDLVHHDTLPLFAKLGQHQEVLWDYQRTLHSTRGHPLSELRPQLQAQHLPTAQELNSFPDGRRLSYVGLVICRQRPGTAKGVTFFTLEDETGFCNLVLWRDVFDHFSLLARSATVLGVTGRIQSEAGVVHLVVQSLWQPQLQQPVGAGAIRNFC